MPTEDRRVGKLLPSPVTPSSTVCFRIEIPNAVQYRAAFLGQLEALGRWETWDHQRSETECVDCETAAQLWRNAIYNAVWSEECEDELDCLDVANCIDNNEAVQGAISNQIINNATIQEAINNAATQGVPLSTVQANTSLTAAANCDNDKLFGSITAIVEQLNTNNVDFLEQLEIESNTIERVSALFAAIPLFETLPIDDALAFVDTVMGEFKEFYDAAYTTALKDTYRCDLFCEVTSNQTCELTFEMLITYFEGRLGASLDNNALFLNMVEYLTTGSWTGTQVVDALTLAQLVIWREASNFLGVSFRTLQTVGILGTNAPSQDWLVLCDTCNDGTCNDFTQGSFGWPTDANANYIAGQGYGRSPGNLSRIGIVRNAAGIGNASNPVKKVVVQLNAPLDGWVRIRNSTGGQQVRIDANQQLWVFNNVTITGGLFVDIGPKIPSGQPEPQLPSTLRLTDVCWYFAI